MRSAAGRSMFVTLIPIVWALSPGSNALAQSARSVTEEQVAHEAAKGNFMLELALGTAGAAIGVTASYLVLKQPAAPCDSGSDVPDLCGIGITFGKVLVPVVLIPALTIAGVMSAGAATGGNGRIGITILGAYAGVAAGELVAAVASRAAGNDSLNVGLAISLATVGLLPGTLIGYRTWARPQFQVPLLALDRNGAALLWSGRF